MTETKSKKPKRTEIFGDKEPVQEAYNPNGITRARSRKPPQSNNTDD